MYFPADYGTSDSNKFLETVAELEGFVLSQKYDNAIICGDFNVDFSRSDHNLDHLMSFMHDYNPISADLNSDNKYTYRSNDCAVSPGMITFLVLLIMLNPSQGYPDWSLWILFLITYL